MAGMEYFYLLLNSKGLTKAIDTSYFVSVPGDHSTYQGWVIP